MNIVRKKESWRRFGTKAVLVTIAILLFFTWFVANYRITYDPQATRCIPEYRVYLVDLNDKEIVKGGLYSYSARKMQPYFADGTKMIKYIKAVPGDTVEVRPDTSIYINNQYSGFGLELAEELGLDKSKFVGKGVLKDGEYWFLGNGERTYDSRYWGAVKEAQVLGRAYALF
jgi:conjugal transfer pilin signal peptidase TrbI